MAAAVREESAIVPCKAYQRLRVAVHIDEDAVKVERRLYRSAQKDRGMPLPQLHHPSPIRLVRSHEEGRDVQVLGFLFLHEAPIEPLEAGDDVSLSHFLAMQATSSGLPIDQV